MGSLKLAIKLSLISLISCFLFFATNTALAVNPILRLETDTKEIYNDEELVINVTLDPLNQPTVGVDLWLNYQPEYLEIIKIDCGTFYPNCPVKSFDNQVGLIKLAASANINDYNLGATAENRLIAEITALAKKSGSTDISFSWEKNSTRETNVVSPQIIDLLTSQPESLTLKISAGSNQTSDPTPTPTISQEQPIVVTPTFASLGSAVPAISKRQNIKENLQKIKEKISEVISPPNNNVISPHANGLNKAQVLGAGDRQATDSPYMTIIIGLLIVIFILVTVIFLLIKRRHTTEQKSN